MGRRIIVLPSNLFISDRAGRFNIHLVIFSNSNRKFRDGRNELSGGLMMSSVPEVFGTRPQGISPQLHTHLEK